VYTHHYETTVEIPASAEDVFAFVDDHAKLSAHMNKRSWMMVGGRMSVQTDARLGKAVGSTIRMSGSILGLTLGLDETVIERSPPSRKIWETIGVPQLLVVGPYRMGVHIKPSETDCQLRVFIDYMLPASGVGRWLGKAFGRSYARWCTEKMANDSRDHFAREKGA